nr:EOG090X09MN [Simocephalus serrulatus]
MQMKIMGASNNDPISMVKEYTIRRHQLTIYISFSICSQSKEFRIIEDPENHERKNFHTFDPTLFTHFIDDIRPLLFVHMQINRKVIVSSKEEKGSVLRSSKIILHLSPRENDSKSRPVLKSSASCIKLAFTEGGLTQFLSTINKVCTNKSWEKQLQNSSKNTTMTATLRSGIVGIERKLQEKVDSSASTINTAFQDMENLIDMAKEMVQLAGVMSNKIKDRRGEISEDDTVKFKSYLLSLGIDDPVTKHNCPSNDKFWKELAREIGTFLYTPVAELGGLMSLSDAYCRVNRARGFELLSAEDFFEACSNLEELSQPITLRKFESGVYVLQLQCKTNSELEKEMNKLLQAQQKLSALDVSQELGIPIMLARERLLTLEKSGLACRDDTVTGLVFYPNFFLAKVKNIL